MTVGRVGRPHGLDGSFVVEHPSAAPERFAVGATLYAAGEQAKVVAVRRPGRRLVVKLDREVPQGAPLAVPRDALPPPAEGAYYVFQLVGLAVEEEGGRPLGHVVDVIEGVANDVLELDTGLVLPLVEACVVQVDIAGARIVVTPGFADPG